MHGRTAIQALVCKPNLRIKTWEKHSKASTTTSTTEMFPLKSYCTPQRWWGGGNVHTCVHGEVQRHPSRMEAASTRSACGTATTPSRPQMASTTPHSPQIPIGESKDPIWGMSPPLQEAASSWRACTQQCSASTGPKWVNQPEKALTTPTMSEAEHGETAPHEKGRRACAGCPGADEVDTTTTTW